MLAFGLAGMVCYLDRRPALAGGLSALAGGTWQLGIIFPLTVAAGVWRRDDRAAEWRYLAGTGVAAVLVCLPVALGGGLRPMLAQIVLGPFVDTEASGIEWRVIKALGHLDVAYVVVLIGLVGAVVAIRTRARSPERPLVAVLIGWFLVQILALDLDGPPDLIPLVAVAALGVGLVVDAGQTPQSSRSDHDRLAASLVVVLLISAILFGSPWGVGYNSRAYGTGNPAPSFWAGESVDQCHVRLSPAEQQWIAATPAAETDTRCWSPRLSPLLIGYSDPPPPDIATGT